MTRRQVARRAFDAEHRRLLEAYHGARGGERTKTWRELRNYVTGTLNAGRKRRRRSA